MIRKSSCDHYGKSFLAGHARKRQMNQSCMGLIVSNVDRATTPYSKEASRKGSHGATFLAVGSASTIIFICEE